VPTGPENRARSSGVGASVPTLLIAQREGGLRVKRCPRTTPAGARCPKESRVIAIVLHREGDAVDAGSLARRPEAIDEIVPAFSRIGVRNSTAPALVQDSQLMP